MINKDSKNNIDHTMETKNNSNGIFKLNYIGSKKLLLEHLNPIFKKYLENSTSFAELFCGTGVISEFIKKEYPNISSFFLNDLNEYATSISSSRIQNLNEKEIKEINHHILKLNELEEEGFFFKNYSNKYFTEQNCKIIDGMNSYIHNIENPKLKMFLKSLLVCYSDSVSNTSCVYGAYLKKIKKSAEKKLKLPLITNWNNRDIEITTNTGDICKTVWI